MKKDKMMLITGIGVVLLVVFTFIFYFMKASFNGIEIVFLIFVAAIIIATVSLLWKKARDIKKGLPVEDELAKLVAYKSGYITYIATIWIAVLTMTFKGFISSLIGVELTVEHFVGIIVLGSGLIFFGTAMYLNSKGNV